MSPKPFERRCTVGFIGRAFGLEVIDADLRSLVHIPTRLGKQRGYVTRRALSFAVEECLAANRTCFCCCTRCRGGSMRGKLIEMKLL
jgi:hypothetical protein